jgi:cell division protein FtsQ
MNRLTKLRPINTRRQGRRSRRRLASQTVRYETTAPRLRLAVRPALSLWQTWGAKITGTFTLVLFVCVLALLFKEDGFYVYGARVEGNVVLTDTEIYAASGLDSQSVFWIDPAQIAANVSRLPNVRAAQVKVSLPAKVTIVVEERLPMLVWQTGQTVWWVDGEGLVVPPRSEITGQLLVIDDNARDLKANDQIAPTVMRGLNRLRLLRPDLHEVHYSQAYGLIISTTEGWPAYLGDGEDMETKLAVLEAVRYDLRARGDPPVFIDVRYPSRVIYR